MIKAPRSEAELSANLKEFSEASRLSLARRFRKELALYREVGECDLVSVILPVYGDIDEYNVRACLKSISAQQGVSIELILVEQTFGEARFQSLAESASAKFVVDRVSKAASGGRFNTGRARNVGIHNASGQFVYTSDADILYVDPHYFSKLVALMHDRPDLVLVWPRMKHLLEDRQKDFCDRFCEDGIWPGSVMQPVGKWAYCWPKEGTNGHTELPRLRDVVHNRIRYIIREEDLEQYLVNQQEMSGCEHMFLRSCRHDGAIMARRCQLDLVAGYAECFFQWGVEDCDLQWKLSELFCVNALAFLGTEVVHLDHAKKWFDRLMWERNNLVHARRRGTGVCTAILSDLLENDSVYGRELRNRVSLVYCQMPLPLGG